MRPLLLFFLLSASSLVAQQTVWTLDQPSSKITYKAVHPLHKWSGVNNQLKGIAHAKTDATLFDRFAILAEVKDFDSQNSNRDAHALEVLDVLDFPQVKFYCENIEMQPNSVTLLGVIEFHGVKIEKSIETKWQATEETINLSGTFDFKASDFGLDLPSFMLAKIQDEIQILFDVTFKKAK